MISSCPANNFHPIPQFFFNRAGGFFPAREGRLIHISSTMRIEKKLNEVTEIVIWIKKKRRDKMEML